MTFGLLGGLLHHTADFAGNVVGTVHRATDDTLDKTGLSAFIPPALHETSDGLLGIVQRGAMDIGHTAGNVLESFEQRPLHAYDKSIGGNLRMPPSQAPRNLNYVPQAELCVICQMEPRVSNFLYCSRECAVEAGRLKKRMQNSRKPKYED